MSDMWRLVTKAVVSSELWNWLTFVVLLAILVALAFLISHSDTDLAFVSISWDEQPFCEQSTRTSNPGADQFAIYTFNDFVGHNLCARFGKIPELARIYVSIRADWSLSGEVLVRLIFERHFDLLQLRPEEIKPSEVSFGGVYHQISYYPPYEAFLISRDGPPTLNNDYLQPRVIGLLANTKSRSGYRYPMRAFHEAGLDPKELHLRHYPNHAELRRALERGEVDVIGTYWDTLERARFPDWYVFEIGGVKEGLSWFLADDVFENLDVRCAILRTLRDIADASENPYFADLHITTDAGRGCNGS